VGRLSQRHLALGVQDFQRRLRPHARVDLLSVRGRPLPRRTCGREAESVVQDDSEALLARASKLGGAYLVALDGRGREFSSVELARFLQERALAGDSHLVWLIGGPLGLSRQLLASCRLVLALSRLTLPHQMVPLILLEQIYRAGKIARGEPYHY